MRKMQKKWAAALLAGTFGMPMIAAGAEQAGPPAIMGQKLTANEKDFAKDVAQANLAEIEQGRIAALKSSSPEVKAFAARMISEHAVAGQRLTQIAAAQSVTLPKRVSEAQRNMTQKMKEEKAGLVFDKTYMTNQVIDHEKLLDKMTWEAARTNNATLKQWVLQQLPTFKEHLEQARQINDQLRNQVSTSTS